MLFQAENPIVRLVGVERMKWNNGKFNVAARPFSALVMRIKGQGEIKCGELTKAIGPSDILYMPQNLGYTANYADTDIIVFHFMTMNDDTQMEVYNIGENDSIRKLFYEAHEMWVSKVHGYNAYTLSMLYNVLGLLYENESVQALPEHFMRAIQYINSNYVNGDLSIKEICSVCGIGQTSFRELFFHFYKKTPIQYITKLRLERARGLILGGMTIASAAYESGFRDPKYFSRVFKKHMGCTPKQLRLYLQ